MIRIEFQTNRALWRQSVGQTGIDDRSEVRPVERSHGPTAKRPSRKRGSFEIAQHALREAPTVIAVGNGPVELDEPRHARIVHAG